ncbi:MAG: PadR family transcriptional regulator [Clostridia bacterium]|nr:PadR family transcriptional regulator [Clostridia bacterium]
MEQRAISSDLIRGHIDTIILHTLLNGDKYAQQISESVEEKSGGDYKLNQATLYSSLKRLENLKHVNSYWYDSASGRRKYFKLTDAGRKTVEENLSSWSYSRAIIDKLMDCAPQPIYKIQYVEKEVPVQIQSTPAFSNEKIVENNSSTNQPELAVNFEKTTNISENQPQDINFRNILNGLIKATTVQTQQQTELTPIEKETVSNEDKPEKLKFNETLNSTDYNAHKSNNNGKIDFGDLTLKAVKEGYKIRISSKDSAISEGTLYVNKLNACSAVLLLVLMVVEFLYFSIRFGAILNLNALSISLVSAFILIYPTISIVKYLKKPNKKTIKKVSGDVILTSAIVVFNLLLITFAANLLCAVDFSNTFTILLSFIIPSILYLDVFLYYIIKFLLSKSDYCIEKLKK